jgi:putative DNA primase/helicase
MAAHAGLAALVAEIATALVGEPNGRLSSKRQLRFGRKGSLAVTTAGPKTGSWYDHENGVGGDLFSLIRRKRGGGFLEALAYAERIIGRRPTQPESPATAACRDQADDCSAGNRRRAGELWQEAVPITATVASRYLVTRRLYPLVDSEGRVLRFHPSMTLLALRLPMVTTARPTTKCGRQWEISFPSTSIIPYSALVLWLLHSDNGHWQVDALSCRGAIQ